MRCVSLGFRMAIRALENGVVVWIGVAGGADSPRPSVIGRPVRVIECGSRPCRGGVACLAGCGETSSNVIGIRRARVVCLVAGIAVGRHGGVVVVYVTVRAWNCGMRPGKGEWSVVVVER